jgi:hypothetical protein
MSLPLPSYAGRAETHTISKCRGRLFANSARIHDFSISLPLTYTFMVKYMWVHIGQACKLWNYLRVNRLVRFLKVIIQCKLPGKFWNAVLKKDEEDQPDRSCVKWNITQSQAGQQCPTYSKEKECYLDWSHLAQELPSRTRYWRKGRGKDTSDGKARKKT